MLYGIEKNEFDVITKVYICINQDYSWVTPESNILICDIVETDITPEAWIHKLINLGGDPPTYTIEAIPEEDWDPDYKKEVHRITILSELNKLQNKLLETDYMVIKINEAIIKDDIELANKLKIQYHDALIEREHIRERIRELQKEIG